MSKVNTLVESAQKVITRSQDSLLKMPDRTRIHMSPYAGQSGKFLGFITGLYPDTVGIPSVHDFFLCVPIWDLYATMGNIYSGLIRS